ncbi:MAG TPA: aminotransferase class III-fold pyridoxal phosphate-dependent enzyme [Acidimicrobiales bacterium]|nr:aminotransferase class III-fold pyridoxal phosphate-dependent enzyme [Acidimicrobiales bacterium]
MASSTTRAFPDSNEAGLELVARHVSAAKVDAFRRLGLRIVQGRREGVRIWDLDGKAYLNCHSSGGVFNFGHRPEFAIRALTRALQELGDMGDWLVPSAVRARGAAALARTLPGDLRYTFFTPGGGEAVEVACKLARATTGRTGIVSAEHGYHGHVGFALAMDEERDSHWFAPLVPGISKVPFGDIAAVERAVDDETAAVCMETVPATAGYLVPPDDYWPRVREICDERGALLILDEVQSGLGRTGRVWACERWGVAPDLLVAGKGLSGGVYPIAACSFGERVDAFFARDPFFHPSSYGGSVVRVTHPRLGVDAHLSNWAWLDGEPWQLDLTTPFLLDEHGRPAFDITPFLAVLPAPVRPVVRREMVTLIRRWTTARGALVDMTAGLLKERLDPWVDRVLTEVNASVAPPISRAEATRIYDNDRRLWPLLFRLERANRWWQRHVRRRAFEFLVPERTTYEEALPGTG